MAGILYYTFKGLGNEAVYQLVNLKIDFNQVRKLDWQALIRCMRASIYAKGGPRWTEDDVGKHIAKVVDHDKFMAIVEIDEDCEKLLRKACCDTRHCSILLC